MYVLIIAAISLFLVGCGSNEESSSASTPDSSSEISSTISTASIADSSSVPQIDFDREHFIKSISEVFFCTYFCMPFETPSELQAEEQEWSIYAFSSNALKDYHVRNGDISDEETHNAIFPIEEFVTVCEEAFGFETDYYNTLNDWHLNNNIPAGFYMVLGGHDFDHYVEVDEDSVNLENNTITIKARYQSFSGSSADLKYYFSYAPENRYWVYPAVKCEVLAERKLVEPTIIDHSSKLYKTTVELNLRYGPGTEYEPPIRTLEQGYTVTVSGYMNDLSDEWVFVSAGRGTGWVNSRYLVPA